MCSDCDTLVCSDIGGTFDISNLDRLGTSEVQQVQCLVDGVRLLINMEKALEGGKDIKTMLPENFIMDTEGGQEINETVESKPATYRAEVKAGNFPDLSKHNNYMARVLTEVRQ